MNLAFSMLNVEGTTPSSTPVLHSSRDILAFIERISYSTPLEKTPKIPPMKIVQKVAWGIDQEVGGIVVNGIFKES